MFLETAIGLFLLGVIAGAILVEVLVAQPARRATYIERTRLIRSQARLLAATRPHRGTPYIDPALEAAKQLAYDELTRDLDDNDRWSRKTPNPSDTPFERPAIAGLPFGRDEEGRREREAIERVVSLPRPRAQTGRPV